MNWFVKMFPMTEPNKFTSNDGTLLVTECKCSSDWFLCTSGEIYSRYIIDGEIEDIITEIPEEFTWKIQQ